MKIDELINLLTEARVNGADDVLFYRIEREVRCNPTKLDFNISKLSCPVTKCMVKDVIDGIARSYVEFHIE